MPCKVFNPNRHHGWTKLPDNDCFELLRKRWWGSKLDCNAGSVVSITDPSTPPGDIPIQLRPTTGQIFVRKEYELMYERLVKKHSLWSKNGVIISGQPGIGTLCPDKCRRS